jgi:ribonucleoside-triphosphate reductase
MAFAYDELQPEMDMINRAYIEVMTHGDAKSRVFTFSDAPAGTRWSRLTS